MTSTDPLQEFLNKLHVLLDAVGTSLTDLTTDREAALTRVVTVARALEGRLAEALGGQPLRGCPNLFNSEIPVYGYNLRKQVKSARIPFPDEPGQVVQALTLLRDGTFQVVEVRLRPERIRGGHVESHAERIDVDHLPAEEGDFRPEDLEPMLCTVVEACVQHLLHSRKTQETAQRIRQLSDAVLDVLLDRH